VRPPVAESRWAARSARARELAAARPEARDALEFFAQLSAFQHSLNATRSDAASALPDYLQWLAQHAPGPVREYAGAGLQSRPPASIIWPDLVSRYAAGTADASPAFIVESLLQVFPPDQCPYCKAPVVSLLREAGHGSRRSYVCGVCLAETPAPRLGCVACGEAGVDHLPIYRSDATEPARIDACDTCHAYMKTIDLTRDGSACPIADDLATVSLDLWAREHGYHRVRPNLLRL
jgi:formate dehydrogenase maturation protein FdhE